MTKQHDVILTEKLARHFLKEIEEATTKAYQAIELATSGLEQLLTLHEELEAFLPEKLPRKKKMK